MVKWLLVSMAKNYQNSQENYLLENGGKAKRVSVIHLAVHLLLNLKSCQNFGLKMMRWSSMIHKVIILKLQLIHSKQYTQRSKRRIISLIKLIKLAIGKEIQTLLNKLNSWKDIRELLNGLKEIPYIDAMVRKDFLIK
jgi:hypothetical protein